MAFDVYAGDRQAATPILNGTNPDGTVKLEKPHLVNPVAFVRTSQNGRVCKLGGTRPATRRR